MNRLLLIIALVCLGNSISYADNGHSNYLLHCRGCHTPTGAAVPAVNMPSLHNLGPLLGTIEGRRYLIQIPGVSHTPLNNKEVAEVLNWVVKNFNPDAYADNFTLFTANEVAEARAKIEVDPNKVREQLQNDS